MLNRICNIAIVAMALAVLNGCGTPRTYPGTFNGLSEDPKRLMSVACTDKPANSCTPKQRQIAAALMIEAAEFVDQEMSGPGEAAAAGGFASAFAGAVAVALTGPIGAVMVITAAENASQGALATLGTALFARVLAVTDFAGTLRDDRIKQKVLGEEAEYIRFIPAFTRATLSMEEFRSGKAPGR